MSTVRPINQLMVFIATFFVFAHMPAHAIAEGFKPDFSLILDAHYKSDKSALSEMDKGFGLGHIEFSVSAPIDDLFLGKYTAVVHEHDGKTELESEEAFIQTLALPQGFTIRAGRFLSDIGYLNGQHTHSDAFTERPVAYRALLGSHYYDDGARLSYILPTDIYWVLGVEALTGNNMRSPYLKDSSSVGVYTAFTKIGGDIGNDQSWQLGLSFLRNENGTAPATNIASNSDHTHESLDAHDHEHEYEHEHEHEHEHDHDHEHLNTDSHSHSHDHHGHCHSAQFIGRNTLIADAVWKWAPDGNYKYKHLALSGEYLQTTDIKKGSGKNLKHDGFYLSGVYQMTPHWTTAARYGEFKGYDHLNSQPFKNRLKETELVLSWSHSHFSTIRLQYTHQQGTGFDHIQNNILTLQYVMSLGAHDAHTF